MQRENGGNNNFTTVITISYVNNVEQDNVLDCQGLKVKGRNYSAIPEGLLVIIIMYMWHGVPNATLVSQHLCCRRKILFLYHYVMHNMAV